jgi:hypothetical protein
MFSATGRWWKFGRKGGPGSGVGSHEGADRRRARAPFRRRAPRRPRQRRRVHRATPSPPSSRPFPLVARDDDAGIRVNVLRARDPSEQGPIGADGFAYLPGARAPALTSTEPGRGHSAAVKDVARVGVLQLAQLKLRNDRGRGGLGGLR